jgi:hypothetical protein
VTMKLLALATGIALVALSGCTSGPAIPTGPVSVHIVHRFQNTTADTFGISRDAGVLHVVVTLENFYRNRCPGPVGAIALQDPNGVVQVRLETQNLPTNDCVYVYDHNQTLTPGYWSVRYIGGSDGIGSIVDIKPTNATADK